MHDPNNPQTAPTSPLSAKQGLSSPESHDGPRWALYARSEGAGIAAQLEALRAYADTQGALILAELVDAGPDRTGRDRAIERARAGDVDAVAAYGLGQLGSAIAEVEHWLDAFEHLPVQLLLLRGPGTSTPTNISTAQGRLALRMFGAMLDYEREIKDDFERWFKLKSPQGREQRPVDDDEA